MQAETTSYSETAYLQQYSFNTKQRCQFQANFCLCTTCRANNFAYNKLFCAPSRNKKMSQPKIGIGVIIEKNKKILLGQRINSHGAHTWSAPGGHLEFGESPEDCAVRETLEETGISIECLRRGIWTNDFFQEENKHYITLFIHAKCLNNDEPKIMEPNKCREWRWCNWDNLPQPLFLPLQHLLEHRN